MPSGKRLKAARMATTLHDDVRSLRRELGQLRTTVEKYHATVIEEVVLSAVCRETVAGHERTLHGANGSPGVVDDVRCLKRLKRAMRVGFGVLFGAIVTLAAAWIASR